MDNLTEKLRARNQEVIDVIGGLTIIKHAHPSEEIQAVIWALMDVRDGIGSMVCDLIEKSQPVPQVTPSDNGLLDAIDDVLEKNQLEKNQDADPLGIEDELS